MEVYPPAPSHQELKMNGTTSLHCYMTDLPWISRFLIGSSNKYQLSRSEVISIYNIISQLVQYIVQLDSS